MLSAKLKIGLLVAAHIVATIVTLAWAALDHSRTEVQNLAYTMASDAPVWLLAIWLIFGTTRFHWRLFVVVIGVACKAVAYYLTAYSDFTEFAVGLTWGVTWASLCIVVATSTLLAGIRVRCHLEQGRVDSSKAYPFQFSLRHMMLIIFAVSFLLASTPIIRAVSKLTVPAHLSNYMSAAIISLCAVWGTLGAGRPQWRVVMGLIVAAALGLWVSLCHYLLWTWFTRFAVETNVLTALIVIASLLVVRSCGWRLVESGTHRSRPQFRFWQLLLLVALVGIGFGNWHWVTRKVVVVRAPTAEDEEQQFPASSKTR